MKVFIYAAALYACTAHSTLYVERIKRRNSHLSHPAVAQNPPLADLYPSGSQAHYTRQYAAYDSYQDSPLSASSKPRGGTVGGYERPTSTLDEDDYQPGYGKPAVVTSSRSVSYPRSGENETVRSTRPTHQQSIQHRQPSYVQAQRAFTTGKPIAYPTTRRPGGYPTSELDGQIDQGYERLHKTTHQFPDPLKKQAAVGGYGNDLEDLEQPSYGGRQPAFKQTHDAYQGTHRDQVDFTGYDTSAPHQDNYPIGSSSSSSSSSDIGSKGVGPANPQPLLSKHELVQRYNVAQELPNPNAAGNSYVTTRSNPDYFPQLTWNVPPVAPVPAFQRHSVQQPHGYVVVDQHANQW